MTGALIILAVLVLTGFVLWLTDRHGKPQPDVPHTQNPDGECCGMHEVCEKVPTTLSPEYFNDEELDAYAGRPADAYSADEIEEFREVMLTLRPDERAPWAVAIERRGIAVPEPLRDELIMLIEDA